MGNMSAGSAVEAPSLGTNFPMLIENLSDQNAGLERLIQRLGEVAFTFGLGQYAPRAESHIERNMDKIASPMPAGVIPMLDDIQDRRRMLQNRLDGLVDNFETLIGGQTRRGDPYPTAMTDSAVVRR